MNKRVKKLALAKETLSGLQEKGLGQVAAASTAQTCVNSMGGFADNENTDCIFSHFTGC